ncbi:hypothetical protein CFIMG_008700RA00001 [Ceratocystis fimbriata CBS 114723]|uniref:Uncharacterized protein n=1 Tax=Ceratocystis fimbriata CBS 114723 TaxID=1035309 RepID=A0A2C5X0C1_9PEZI|nr:hypothetical protein CFIMG_008700RA00001 [Ceratocystis fimbriata CBS 114723]
MINSSIFWLAQWPLMWSDSSNVRLELYLSTSSINLQYFYGLGVIALAQLLSQTCLIVSIFILSILILPVL